MKKLFAVTLVLFAISASAFAGDSYLSFSLAPEFDFAFGTIEINNHEFEKDSSNGYFGLAAEWTNYFGESSIAGLLLGFTYNIPMYSKSGDFTAPEPMLDSEMIPKVGLALKFDLSERFSLESGISAAFAIGKATDSYSIDLSDGRREITETTKIYSIEVYGRLGMIWKFSKSWALRTGLDIAYIISSSTSTSGSYTFYSNDGYSYSGSTSGATGSGMSELLPDLSITPYLGIAFCY